MLAAEAGHLESCLLLLEAQADLNARVGDDQLGGTVLRYAQRGPTMAFLSALLGQQPNTKDLAPALNHPAAKKLLKAYQPKMYEDVAETPAVKLEAESQPAKPPKTVWPRAERSSCPVAILISVLLWWP